MTAPPGERHAEEAPESRTRRSPALAALFESMKSDGRHAVLDLGHADGRRLSLLGPYACRIRFAGVVGRTDDEAASSIRRLSEAEGAPYDVVLVWDALDRLEVGSRDVLVERLVEVTAPGARLYAVVDGSGAEVRKPLELTLVALDQVEERPLEAPSAPHAPLLPAEVERLVKPFEIVHAFTLRSGLREYVATKGA